MQKHWSGSKLSLKTQMKTLARLKLLFCLMLLGSCQPAHTQDKALDAGQQMTEQAAQIKAKTQEILNLLKKDAGSKPDVKSATSKPDAKTKTKKKALSVN